MATRNDPAHRRTCTLALLLALSASGCITRSVRETVYEDPTTQIVLRHDARGSETVDAGYSHPVAIAPVRLAHVFSRIDVRTESDEGAVREPALPTEALYPLADQVSAALAKADSSQQVVVYWVKREKRFNVFDRNYLYSFVVYAKGDALMIHLSHLDWEIPRHGAARNDRLPEPRIDKHPMKFRVVSGKAMTPVDTQALAVIWRDDIFKRPTRTRVGRDGQIVRRTILMESPEEEAEEIDDGVEAPPVSLPETLSASTLRALADLEDQRANGEVTEAEYNLRRLEIIRDDPASQSGAAP